MSNSIISLSKPSNFPNYQLPLNPTRKLHSCHVCKCSHSFHNQELSQNSTELQFIHKKKLLSELSTWGIGGPCNYFVQVFNQTQLLSAIRYCNERSMRFIILGKGSNCLFDDTGFDGCVILNRIEFLEKKEPGVYRVGSGYPFNRLGVVSANEDFSGLEFAGGVPGTVGGAAYMNAGANGQETADSIDSIEVITNEGESRMLKRRELNFGYRSSPFQEMKDLAYITAVTFRLKFSKTAREWQQEYLARRWRTQPLGQRSAGSVFRNPPSMDVSAAELIERAGLKGLKIGGAMVSNKHANFFINCGSATSQDMLELLGLVKNAVNLKYGVELKEEILRWRTQPLRQKVVGSVFRNPSSMDISAAELIEKVGWKGLKVGGAMVSNKRANFFINYGTATSQDMLELIGLVKDVVSQKFGVELKEEILYILHLRNSLDYRTVG